MQSLLTDVIVTTRQKMALHAEAAANMAEMANEPLRSCNFFFQKPLCLDVFDVFTSQAA